MGQPLLPIGEDYVGFAGGLRCTSLLVGEEERGWSEGRAVLFDDSFVHEVWNNCSSVRVVLQAVFTHPGLVGGVGGGGGARHQSGRQGAGRSEL